MYRREIQFSEADYFISEHECGRATLDSITVDGTTYRVTDPQQGVYGAFVAAMREHYPRTMLRLDWR